MVQPHTDWVLARVNYGAFRNNNLLKLMNTTQTVVYQNEGTCASALVVVCIACVHCEDQLEGGKMSNIPFPSSSGYGAAINADFQNSLSAIEFSKIPTTQETRLYSKQN